MATLSADWPVRRGYSTLGPHERTPARYGVPIGLRGDRWLTDAEEQDLEALGVLPARYRDWQMGYREASKWVELLTVYDTRTMQDERARILDECNAMTIGTASGKDPTGTQTEVHLLHCPSGRWCLYLRQTHGEEEHTRIIECSQASGRAKLAEAKAGLR